MSQVWSVPAPPVPSRQWDGAGVDERGLVDAVISGDRDAFALLVERETPALFRACYRILGDVADAEDAVQETFVTAYRAIATYRGEGSLGAWLARIATRQALRRFRGQRPTTSIDEAADSLELPAAVGDPLRDAVAAETQRSVRAAVAALDEPYREVVALRFFGELSLAEIASATDRPIGTVKAQLHRGLQRLRRVIEVPAA